MIRMHMYNRMIRSPNFLRIKSYYKCIYIIDCSKNNLGTLAENLHMFSDLVRTINS